MRIEGLKMFRMKGGASVVILFFALFITACKKKDVPKVEYAQEMRQFVQEISNYGKTANPNFLIVPQNGAALITSTTEKDGVVDEAYLAAIDGQGQEDLFFGYNKDDKATPDADRLNLLYYLNLMEDNEVQVLVTDYCSTQENVLSSYEKNEANGFISFVANERKLNNIPDYLVNVHNENAENITSLGDAKNFLYLINPTEKYANKGDFINAVKETNYDLIIMDKDFNEEEFTAEEVLSLKTKKNGGTRLVIAYMSIGEAEDYRAYWKSDWKKKKTEPKWLYRENKKWRGNYKVFYWMPEWKALIYGNESAYLDKIIGANFDGTYLDIVDAYSYYEAL